MLIAHDPEDPEAPFSDAEGLSAVVPAAELITLEGAGHHRTVLDERAVSAAVSFVRAAREPNARADQGSSARGG